jgi:prophage antirepressor-like protein
MFKNNCKMNDVQIFNSPMFGDLRVVRDEKGELLFCLKDVCNSLELQVTKVKDRLTPYLPTIKVGVVTGKKSDGSDSIQYIDMYFVTEPDLYRCIFQSRKSSARKFQDWVFDEVLPALRKDGGYIVSTDEDTEEDIIARGLIAAKAALSRKEQRVRELEAQTEQQAQTIGIQQKELTVAAPKVKYYDDTLASTDCLTATQVADDLGISARALNQQLSNAGIQYFQSGSWHLKGKYREWQLASTRTYNYIKGDGSTGTKVNLVWNQRGKRFILALYNNDFNVKDAIAEINGDKRAALESKNNQSNF